MTTTMNNSETRIPVDRCAPGGLAGIDAMDWALRAGLASLALAALWFVIIVIKPLPSGDVQEPPAIPSVVAINSGIATIVERESRLASLNAGGNFFASDRKNWPVYAPKADDNDTETALGRNASETPTAIAANHQDIDSIELAENAPTAIKKRLDQIKLRGVYVVRGEPIAMIGKKTNSGSVSYRVGDSFDDDEWRLVAIDDVRDRVILNRSGLNFELKLYDTGTGASPRTSISATNATGEVEIGFTSLDKVAAELREAGVPRDQINELITLAQTNPDGESEPEITDGDGREDVKPIAIPPAMPPGMVQLFRAMAEGSRDVVAPPPVVKTEDDDKAPAEDDAAESESSDKEEDEKDS